MDVYIPTLIDAIFLPSQFCQLKLFRKTLYALFIWKNFITELIATVKVSLTSRSQGANPCTTQGANPCIQGANPFPQIHYACCRLLTGMILSETSTGKAMIVSSVEIYGRRRSLDAHRESFQVKKRLPLPHHCLLKGQEFQTCGQYIAVISMASNWQSELKCSTPWLPRDIKPEAGPGTRFPRWKSP